MKRLIVLLLCMMLLLCCLTGCELDDSSSTDPSQNEGKDSSGKIKMPQSAAAYIGSEWTIETLTAYFEELGFTNVRPVPCEPNEDNYRENIHKLVIEKGLFSDDPWEAGEKFPATAEITIYYNEFPLLTVENCPDLAAILSNKDSDCIAFYTKYDGRYVDFEAYVTDHISYQGDTSHIIHVAGRDAATGTTGWTIYIGDRTWGHSIDTDVVEGNYVTVSGRIDASWSEYYKCLYVETLSLKKVN